MGLQRREFIATITGAAAASLLKLDRTAFADNPPGGGVLTDYVGRLCYNENPLGPSPDAVAAIEAEAGMAHRYSDWFAESLVSAIGDKYGFSANRIVCGAGASEILRMCAMITCGPGTNVVVPTPSYWQFPADAQLLGSSVRNAGLDSNHKVDFEAMLNQVDGNTAAVCITNPNNPTATVYNPDDLLNFVDALPDGVVTIIDEAYYDYIDLPGYTSALDLITLGKNVIVVKTFSKVYGLAGARIGFAIGLSSTMSDMRAVRILASVSRPALEAAKAALGDAQHVADTVSLATDAKNYCFNEFDRMNLTYIPSHASFFMVDVGVDSGWVRGELASRNIYVRDGWGMPHHLRVSTGTMEEMQSFITELEDILTSMRSDKELPLPKQTTMYQAYPNPFNSSTQIRIYLRNTMHAKLEVFDIRGRQVNKLVDNILTAGEYSYRWTGRNMTGKNVTSGAYFYRLTAGDDVITKRMLLVR
jgi:histidinol-phosphate aminotransferase